MKILMHEKMQNILKDIKPKIIKKISRFITDASKANSVIDILNMHETMVKLDVKKKDLYLIRLNNNLRLVIQIKGDSLKILDIVDRNNF